MLESLRRKNIIRLLLLLLLYNTDFFFLYEIINYKKGAVLGGSAIPRQPVARAKQASINPMAQVQKSV